MFIRRVIQRNAMFRLMRNFSEVATPEGQPKAQTIVSDAQTEAEKKTPKEEQMKTLNEYKEALHFFQQGKYRISNEFFNRVLTHLEATGQEGSDNHIHILKKLVSNQLMLRRYADADEYLEEIVDTVQKHTTNDAIIYAQYNNLFLHRLRVNVNKAILMGKALLSETEKHNLPLIYQKQFLFNLGTAYLLKGNYVDAKTRLRECLMMQPNNLLKGYVLNNLAVASWWHKFPNFSTLPEDEEGSLDSASGFPDNDAEYSFSQIDQDFANVIPLFKNSLYNIENVPNVKDSETKALLEELLDQQIIAPKGNRNLDPDTHLLINAKEAGAPLLNIGEFLFNTSPEKRSEATFWFKYALKFFEKNDPSNIDRCLITLALFCASSKQYLKAEGLFRRALEMLENSDSYNKVLCLQLYGQMLTKIPNRQKEGEKLLSEAYSLADQLPFWSNKMIHVCIPDLDL